MYKTTQIHLPTKIMCVRRYTWSAQWPSLVTALPRTYLPALPVPRAIGSRNVSHSTRSNERRRPALPLFKFAHLAYSGCYVCMILRNALDERDVEIPRGTKTRTSGPWSTGPKRVERDLSFYKKSPPFCRIIQVLCPNPLHKITFDASACTCVFYFYFVFPNNSIAY
jgi:hypothetical protein